MNEFWKAIQDVAIDGKISVPMLLGMMKEHLGIEYATQKGKGISQTPVYNAIRRSTIKEATPPPYQKGKWMVVDGDLRGYLEGVVERQEKEKHDQEGS